MYSLIEPSKPQFVDIDNLLVFSKHQKQIMNFQNITVCPFFKAKKRT